MKQWCNAWLHEIEDSAELMRDCMSVLLRLKDELMSQKRAYLNTRISFRLILEWPKQQPKSVTA